MAVAGAKWDFAAEAGMKEAWKNIILRSMCVIMDLLCWPQDLEGIKAAPRPNANAPPPRAGAAGAAIGLHLEYQLFVIDIALKFIH